MARGISSIVTTAVVAGAIGFGAGVYFVPNEKADQFRALVQAWRDLVHSDKANPDSHPSESSQTKAPAETSRTEAQPDIPGGSRPGADAKCDPGDSTCRGGLPVGAAAPQGIPDRDVAAPSSSSPGQDDQPSHALDTDPSGTVPPNSLPTIGSDAPTPVAPPAPTASRSSGGSLPSPACSSPAATGEPAWCSAEAARVWQRSSSRARRRSPIRLPSTPPGSSQIPAFRATKVIYGCPGYVLVRMRHSKKD